MNHAGNVDDGSGRSAREPTDVGSMHAPIAREQEEPEDGYEPLPTPWLLAVLGLMLWGGWYLGTYNAGFAGRVYDGSVPTLAAAEAAPPIDPTLLGRRVFNNCTACHQADGRGVAGQFPPLVGSEWVLGDPEVIVRILLQGLEGPVTVLGNAYNGVMPAWERLGDEELAAVMSYVREHWGNDASAITPDWVARVRQQTSGRASAWTASELAEFTAGPRASP